MISQIHGIVLLVGGYTYPSEKYEFVSWDDEIPNYIIWTVIQNSMVPVTTNQFAMFYPHYTLS